MAFYTFEARVEPIVLMDSGYIMLHNNKTRVISPCPFMNLSVLHDVEQPNM